MPPKRGEDHPKTMLLGRPGTHLKMGIVGLPNVGKSSFFNEISKRQVPAENRPFCTIEPNIAEISVPDARFDKMCHIYKPMHMIPAQLQVRDIAGLVKGSSQGGGIGNAFLSHISEVDGIYHVCRAFEDESVIHVDGDVNPVRDLEVVFSELIMKDLAHLATTVDKLRPIVDRGLDKTTKSKMDLECALKIKQVLEAGTQVRCAQWTNKEIEFLNTLQLLTAKPAVFLVNLSEADYLRQKNKWLPKLKAWIDEKTGEPLIPFSCEFEENFSRMTPEEVQAFLHEHPKTHSQIMKIITQGYRAINLIHFFTKNDTEVRCWTIQHGTTAPIAAGKIHTDMEKGFICAEVIHWEDFDKLESHAKCHEEGKLHQMGRTYEVADGDIVLFKFNPSKGGGPKVHH